MQIPCSRTPRQNRGGKSAFRIITLHVNHLPLAGEKSDRRQNTFYVMIRRKNEPVSGLNYEVLKSREGLFQNSASGVQISGNCFSKRPLEDKIIQKSIKGSNLY
jgi:hypothetical protein